MDLPRTTGKQYDPAYHGIPGPSTAVVLRPRLFERLERGARGPATLVSGPAGSGKTLLVASWLRDAERAGSVAWVSVESDACDAMRFWGVVVARLQACPAAANARVLQMLTPGPHGAGREFVQRLAEGLAELRDPILLVLDDLHELRAEEAVSDLADLLGYRLPQLRLMLISRRDPRLALHRLRVAGELTEVRGRDLAFTVDEARELLSGAGVHPSEAGLQRLRARTEGWAAGLRLTAMSLAGRTDPERLIAELSGSERTVADYLMGEVLDGQPPAVRHLLLRTSMLHRINGPLANLLAGVSDGQRTLRELEDSGAFVESVDEGRSWFRYHPLLADFLRGQLEAEAPEEIEPLHRAAARWFASEGFALEAIRHSEAAADWACAAELLLEHWLSLFLDGELPTLHELLTALQTDVLQRDAELAVLVALDRLTDGRVPDAAAYIALARRLAASVPAARRPRFEVVLAVAELFLARTRGAFAEAIEGAQALLTPASGQSWEDVISNEDLRATVLMNLGLVELWALRLDDAERHLQEGLALARRIGRPYLELCCLGPAAEVALLTGRLSTGGDRARAAIELAERLGCSDGAVAGVAYSALGGILFGEARLAEAQAALEHAERGLQALHDIEAAVVLRFRVGLLRFGQRRYADAIGHFTEAERAQERIGAPHYLGAHAANAALRARIQLGDTRPARRALGEAPTADGRSAEWCQLAAEVHLAEDEPQAAIDALAPLLEGTIEGFHPAQAIQARFLEAAALDRLGQARAAELAIEQALGLAKREGWYSFALTAPQVMPLLERHARQRRTHSAFLTEVIERCGGTSPGEPLPAALSERELEVLQLLTTNLSAAEIAAELLVSVHTVKTHMRSIYAKLDAHRRSEAVDRARSLGLLGRRTIRAMAD